MALAIKPPRPKRKCGTPVRTGCITCKIRRVKCDEKRPSCNRCTSTGRKCDGYEPVVAKQRTATQPPVPRTISPNIAENPKELKLLHFFSGITAPIFSSNFSSDFNFWRRVLQVGHGEPSIRHAVIALGALHQKFIFNNSQSIANVLELQTFAFQQHTAAISHLHKLMGSQRQRLEITMISCMLFICFDSLLGHHTSAIIHLEAGLKILQSMKIQAAHDPAKLVALGSWERDFVPLLLRMGLQAVLFVNPANKDEKLSLWRALSKAVHKYEDQDQDSPFTSLQEASNYLDRISIAIGYERKMVKDRIEAKLTSIPSPNNEVVMRHVGDLHTWSHKLNGYLVNLIQNGCMDQRTTRVAALLKIHWLFMMAVANKPEPSDHWFSKILFLCKKLIDTPDANTSQNLSSDLNFTPDMGIIAPLLYIILTFPEDPMISNEAYRLLCRAPRREGMWDGEQARKMVDMFIKARNNAGKIAIVNVLKSPYRGTSLVNNETEGSGTTNGTDEILNRVLGLESSYSHQAKRDSVGVEDVEALLRNKNISAMMTSVAVAGTEPEPQEVEETDGDQKSILRSERIGGWIPSWESHLHAWDAL